MERGGARPARPGAHRPRAPEPQAGRRFYGAEGASGRHRRARGAAARNRLRGVGPRRHRRPGRARRPLHPHHAAEARRRRADGSLKPRGGRSRRPRRPRHRPLLRAQDHRGGRGAARLPGNPLRRQRPAVPAGGEHRASLPLRRGGIGGRSRPARRRRLAEPQGAAQEAHPRHGGAADQDGGRAADAAGAGALAALRPLRRILGALSLRGDGRPGRGDRRGARRPFRRAADGPARLRRRRLRQDGSGAPRRLRRGDGGTAGRRRRADDASRPPALCHLHRALPRPAAQYRAGLAAGRHRPSWRA